MKTIKKISEVTPLNGEVVDSLSGSSTTNAPSIRAVNEGLSSIIESGTINNVKYIKFSDGTMFQMGRLTIDANSNAKTLTWAIPFNDSDIFVSFTNAYQNSKSIIYSIASITTTNVNVYPIDTSTNANPTVSLLAKYIAIGRWK